MTMRSLRYKSVVVAAVAAALGAPIVACSSDDSTQDNPDGGGDQGTGGKASGGSAGKGSGGSAAGSTGTGGTAVGAGGSKGGAGGLTGGASGGSAGKGGTASGGMAGASAGGAAGGAGTPADSGADGADGCVATESLTPPTVADAIKPPDGTKLVHHFHAIGTQNYTCTSTPGTGGADPTYGYGASTPEALLYDSCGKEVIHHFAGPTWQWLADSSSVKGAKLAGVDVAGSIPLLLLKGTPQTATGELSAVSYIQRLDTTGGAAPAAATCTAAHVGEVTKVDYTANYYFYEGPPVVDAGHD